MAGEGIESLLDDLDVLAELLAEDGEVELEGGGAPVLLLVVVDDVEAVQLILQIDLEGADIIEDLLVLRNDDKGTDGDLEGDGLSLSEDTTRLNGLHESVDLTTNDLIGAGSVLLGTREGDVVDGGGVTNGVGSGALVLVVLQSRALVGKHTGWTFLKFW